MILQFMGVTGAMKVSFKAQEKGTPSQLVYAVSGYDAGDFKEISQGDDAVLGEQIKRYGSVASTGEPLILQGFSNFDPSRSEGLAP